MGEIASESEMNPTPQNPGYFDTSPQRLMSTPLFEPAVLHALSVGSFPLRTFFQRLSQRRSLMQTRTGFGPAASRSKLTLCDHVSVRKLPDTEFQSTAYWRTFEDHL
jgi:hypothetical protein